MKHMRYTAVKWNWWSLSNLYRLDHEVRVQLTYIIGFDVGEADWFWLSREGLLTVSKGFKWDGPSGPTYDTPNSMRASLAHDVLYILIMEGHIPMHMRKQADQELRRIALEDGMHPFRAWYWYRSLRMFGWLFI